MTTLGFTCLKDDGPYILEWVAHHLAAGFDKMLVLTHHCTDGSDALLDLLSADDRIEHLSFEKSGDKAVQWQALSLASKHPAYKSADWALFFDVDEFLCLDGPADLLGLIGETGGDAVALPWRFFGSGGEKERRDGLTPERFTRAAPWDLHFPFAHLFKTLHRPSAFQKPGVHRPRARKDETPAWVGPDGAKLPSGFGGKHNFVSLYAQVSGRRIAWLNHYSLRSQEEFLIKRGRGLPNHTDRAIDLTYWVERNWNTLEDDTITKMLPATRAEYARLLSLPGVANAHESCISAHAKKWAALSEEQDVLQLAFRLDLAGDSVAPTSEQTRSYLHALSRRR
ncbi:MAG: glycosyltransferase family 2 protein [Pseudomonadota bacterium]